MTSPPAPPLCSTSPSRVDCLKTSRSGRSRLARTLCAMDGAPAESAPPSSSLGAGQLPVAVAGGGLPWPRVLAVGGGARPYVAQVSRLVQLLYSERSCAAAFFLAPSLSPPTASPPPSAQQNHTADEEIGCPAAAVYERMRATEASGRVVNPHASYLKVSRPYPL